MTLVIAPVLVLQAIKQHGEDADLLARRANVYIKLGDSEAASADANKSTQLNPKHFRGFMMKGYESC